MVIDTLILVGNIATYFFVWSYKTGQFIVSALCFIARSLYVSSEKLCYLSRILVGDFELFVQDLCRTSNNIMNSVGDIYNDYSRIIDQVFRMFLEYSLLITYGIRNIFSSVYLALQEAVICMVNIVKLIGPAIWFLITLPYAILQLIGHCICYMNANLQKQFLQSYKSFQKLHRNLLKVPLETCTELAFIIIFIYLVIKCRKFISKVCSKFIMLLFSFLNLNFIKFPFNMFKLIFIKSKHTGVPHQGLRDENLMCIICQSNPRSIVLLPCRHLCLCDKCSNELVRYQTNCPVCRQETNLKLRVYL